MPYPNIQVLTTMGYNNFDKFRLDVFRLNRYYFHGLKARSTPGQSPLSYDVFRAHYMGNIANAWGMLVNTMDNPLGTVLLGRVAMQFPMQDPQQIASLDEMVGVRLRDSTVEVPLLDEAMHKNFGIATEYSSGSISWSNNWTLLMNDALILGGIQKNLPFYLVSKRIPENIWDARGNRLTVTGRELVALLTSGYKIQRMADGSEYLYNDSEQPRGLTLPEYNRAVDYFSFVPRRWGYLTEPNLTSIEFDFLRNMIVGVEL